MSSSHCVRISIHGSGALSLFDGILDACLQRKEGIKEWIV